MEILDSEGKILHVRRLILLNSQSVWQRVIIPYVPNNSGTFNIKIKGVIYAVGNDRFQIGNMNVYMNDAPVNTGHNSGLSMSGPCSMLLKAGVMNGMTPQGIYVRKKACLRQIRMALLLAQILLFDF